MIRTTLDQVYIKRPLRVNYGWTQTTPKHGYLDPAWDRSVPIWPGMVMMKTLGQNYTLINATGQYAPAGLSALWIGGDGIDEPQQAGVNAIAVWVLEPDAEFEVMAPAFDASLTWTDPGDGTEALVYARTANGTTPVGINGLGGALGTSLLRGQLVPSATPAGGDSRSAVPVARLISVNSATSITIGGLQVHSTYAVHS